MSFAWVIASAAVVALGFLVWQGRHTHAQMRALKVVNKQLERDNGQIKQKLGNDLEQAHQLRDLLLRATDDALLVLDADQNVLFANAAVESLLGSHVVGKSLQETLQKTELDMLVQDAQMVGSEGMERRIELGRHILEARAVTSLAAANGSEPMGILVLRDVTHIQRLERARREMVSNITHELSTPITTIGLLAETLLNYQGKAKQMRKMAKDISREVDTLTQLVQEVRDLSLIESGQMPVRLMPTSLTTIVTASVAQLEALAESKKQKIWLDVPDDLQVLADDLQIQRALKNIVHNAIKFSPEGGKIRVSCTASADEVVVAVTDDGPGIPSEELPRIFERFYQVDRARRDGTGLGLAIVRHIVRAHGGRTWVESIEGQGATFFISLTLADEEVESAPFESAADPNG
ncbi:MAG: PAS domain S-box protein [Anaerolineae bacterium]|nr:PAS domain S-box protein [Anaerolineae bacterium]